MLAVLSTLSLGWAPPADPCAAHSFSYTCKTAPINKRVDDLLSKLSTQELIQQTWSPNSAPTAAVGKVGQYGVGQLSYGTSVLSHGEQGSVEARILRRNSVQEKIMAASRHGIPASFHAECLHSATPGGTVFPELVTQGATWDPPLIGLIGAAIAKEASAVGIDTAFSPVINMWTDSRFGRLQEGYSEEPTLSAAYAAAQAQGLQGPQPPGRWEYFDRGKVVALAKHYVAYGAAAGGLNGAPAELTERTLREWYIAPWRAFAQARHLPRSPPICQRSRLVCPQPRLTPHPPPFLRGAGAQSELRGDTGRQRRLH